MDIQALHMYQRNSNEQGQPGRQRHDNSGNGDDNKGDNPRKKGISPLRVSLLIIALVSVLEAGSLFLNGQGSNMNGQPVGELPYSTFYQQVMDGNVRMTFQGDIKGDFKNVLTIMENLFSGQLQKTSITPQIPRRPKHHRSRNA
jgi:hypothetical protein